MEQSVKRQEIRNRNKHFNIIFPQKMHINEQEQEEALKTEHLRVKQQSEAEINLQKENQRKEEQQQRRFEEATSDPSFVKLKDHVIEVANGADYCWRETAKGFQFSNEELKELISLWKSLTRQKLWPVPTGLAHSAQHKEDLAKRVKAFLRQIDILSKVAYDPERECFRQMTEEEMRQRDEQ